MQHKLAIIIVVISIGTSEAVTGEQNDIVRYLNHVKSDDNTIRAMQPLVEPRWREIDSYNDKKFKLAQEANLRKRSPIEIMKWYSELQEQLVQQTMRQRMAEKDHFMMEKWLVDNINDLHRELKQTENDFEHYAQVTKQIMAQNERLIKQQQQQASMFVPHVPYFIAQVPHNMAPIKTTRTAPQPSHSQIWASR